MNKVRISVHDAETLKVKCEIYHYRQENQFMTVRLSGNISETELFFNREDEIEALCTCIMAKLKNAISEAENSSVADDRGKLE